MEYLNVFFDDFVVENEGKWSQICDRCLSEHFSNHRVSDIPITNLICGVKECLNEADYYLDFSCETTGTEKT